MSTTLTVGTIKRTLAILIAIAIVVAAGVLVGQAPAIFDAEVAEDPEASIEFEDQRGNATSVTVADVSASEGGFVVVTDPSGEIVAVSEKLGEGDHENVTVERREDSDRELRGWLTATVHQDATENGTFVPGEDHPYLDDGHEVSDTATVTTAERTAGDPPADSFAVEGVSGPGQATTNDTLEFRAGVRNPTDHQLSQDVELRVGGSLLERQALSLEPGERREVAFEVDGAHVEPGTHTYGVYTTEDGEQGEIEVAFAGPPSIEIGETDPTNETVTAAVAIPDDGYVAIESADGDLLGTSEPLAGGVHGAVTVDLDDSPGENGTVTAVAYEGAPGDGGTSAYEIDGERVAATVAFGGADD